MFIPVAVYPSLINIEINNLILISFFMVDMM